MKNLIGLIVFFLVLSLGFSVVAGEKPKKIRADRQVFMIGMASPLNVTIQRGKSNER